MIRLVRRSTIYEGKVIRLLRDVLEYRGQRMMRETVWHPGAVVVVPILDHNRLVMVRQYRHAIRRTLLELPAGTLEAGEKPMACARWELIEETGWEPARLRRIGRFYAAPGVMSELMSLFLAQDLRPAQAKPDSDEWVKPVALSFASALAKIRSGAICDAKTIIGIYLALEQMRGTQSPSR